MDENTRFLIERMDALEARLSSKIDELQGFKNKVMGMALIVSSAVSAVVQFLTKHI